MIAESEALLTMSFLFPEPDAFFLLAVVAAAFFPLAVVVFLRAESKPKSLSGSSTSITMESTDSASSSSAPARALPPR